MAENRHEYSLMPFDFHITAAKGCYQLTQYIFSLFISFNKLAQYCQPHAIVINLIANILHKQLPLESNDHINNFRCKNHV